MTEPEEEEEDDEEYNAPPAGFGLPPTVPAHLLSEEDLAEITQYNQAAVERKLELDLSQPSSKPPQFQPPSGNKFFDKENLIFVILIKKLFLHQTNQNKIYFLSFMLTK